MVTLSEPIIFNDGGAVPPSYLCYAEPIRGFSCQFHCRKFSRYDGSPRRRKSFCDGTNDLASFDLFLTVVGPHQSLTITQFKHFPSFEFCLAERLGQSPVIHKFFPLIGYVAIFAYIPSPLSLSWKYFLPALFASPFLLSLFFICAMEVGSSSPRSGTLVINATKDVVGIEQAKEKNPHALPNFNSDPAFSEPKLYLPPLLSSLPEHLLHHQPPLDPQFPPLVTETRLPDIDPASLSLHKALHHFKPLSPNYASLPYDEAFNWSELVLPKEEEREWYCVVFRSKRKAGRDDISLYDADKFAHEEAIRNGGLILYWYGVPNEVTGMNLATCIWQSRKHATAANSQPHHIKAMRLASQAYQIYTLERYRLQKVQGDTGVTIVPYEGGEVGW